MAVVSDLKNKGIEHFLLAKNYEEADAILANNQVDLMLVDINLPGGTDGIELVEKTQNQFGRIPVIYVTASTDPQTLQRMLDTGPNAIINKPVDYRSLYYAVLTATSAPKLPAHEPGKSYTSELGLIYDTAAIGMCVTDQYGNFVRVNKAYCRTYGYTAEFLTGRNFTVVVPSEQKSFAQKLHDDFIHENIVEIPSEWQVQTADGEIKDVYVTAGRYINDDGEVFKVTTVTDISAKVATLKKLEKALLQKETLEKEVHHRVKNNLNLISSLFHLQKMKLEDNHIANSILESGISRLRSLSILHEMLYHREDLSRIDLADYLKTLSDSILDSLSAQKIQKKQAFQSLLGSIDQAVGIGLIINEILTNAVKHAFNDHSSTPEVSIALNSISATKASIIISDNGKPLPKDFSIVEAQSLGMQVVNALTDQLDGKISFEQQSVLKQFVLEFSIT